MEDLAKLLGRELIPFESNTLLDTMRDDSLPLQYRMEHLLRQAEDAQKGPGTAFTPSGYLQLLDAIEYGDDPRFGTMYRIVSLQNYLQQCVDQSRNRAPYVDRAAEERAQVGAAAVRNHWEQARRVFEGENEDVEDIRISELW